MIDKIKRSVTFRFYKTDDEPYIGAYKLGSFTKGEPTILFNMEAVFEVIKDEKTSTDKAEVFRDIMLQTITHEFCHAMQEWLGKEYDELEVEKILGAYNEKWNVFNAEKSEDDEGMVFKISDLLTAIDNMNWDGYVTGSDNDFKSGYNTCKDEIRNLFAPMLLWHEAEKKDKEQKEK